MAATFQIEPPLCGRCLSKDRLHYVGTVDTDFGGKVSVWVCKRDGVLACLFEGVRPPG